MKKWKSAGAFIVERQFGQHINIFVVDVAPFSPYCHLTWINREEPFRYDIPDNISSPILVYSVRFQTLWNMPENIRYVQNLMGSILDTIESFKNIFNWTVPYKVGI